MKLFASNWDIFKTPYEDAMAAFYSKRVPSSCTIVHFRRISRLKGLWPLPNAKGNRQFYGKFNMMIIIFLSIMTLSLAADVCASTDDLVRLGDDMVMFLGVGLILFKVWLCRIKTPELESLVLEMDHIHQSIVNMNVKNQDICEWQRFYFMAEMLACSGYTILGTCLVFVICLHPVISQQSFPINSRFPFQLENYEKHPNFYPWIYLAQVIFLWYSTSAIVSMDSVTCAFFSQTSVNLKILCIRLREIGNENSKKSSLDLKNQLREIVLFHQLLISMVNRINDSLNWNYLAQMSASTFIICLTAFESLLANDRPLVAIKFQIYMFAGLSQLFYWCFMCNIMYFDSMEVANAAWDVRQWFEQSPEFQRNLMFIIQRAQKPLKFHARSLPALNFELFMSILSSSYSYFTLLRSFLD